GWPPRPVLVLGHPSGRCRRRRQPRFGRPVARAHAWPRRLRRQEPGPEHPTERDRGRAAPRWPRRPDLSAGPAARPAARPAAIAGADAAEYLDRSSWRRCRALVDQHGRPGHGHRTVVCARPYEAHAPPTLIHRDIDRARKAIVVRNTAPREASYARGRTLALIGGRRCCR